MQKDRVTGVPKRSCNVSIKTKSGHCTGPLKDPSGIVRLNILIVFEVNRGLSEVFMCLISVVVPL